MAATRLVYQAQKDNRILKARHIGYESPQGEGQPYWTLQDGIFAFRFIPLYALLYLLTRVSGTFESWSEPSRIAPQSLTRKGNVQLPYVSNCLEHVLVHDIGFSESLNLNRMPDRGESIRWPLCTV